MSPKTGPTSAHPGCQHRSTEILHGLRARQGTEPALGPVLRRRHARSRPPMANARSRPSRRRSRRDWRRYARPIARPSILSVHRSQASRTLRLVDRGESIVTTDGHPFLKPGSGWTRAGALKPGDLVQTCAGHGSRRGVRERGRPSRLEPQAGRRRSLPGGHWRICGPRHQPDRRPPWPTGSLAVRASNAFGLEPNELHRRRFVRRESPNRPGPRLRRRARVRRPLQSGRSRHRRQPDRRDGRVRIAVNRSFVPSPRPVPTRARSRISSRRTPQSIAASARSRGSLVRPGRLRERFAGARRTGPG